MVTIVESELLKHTLNTHAIVVVLVIWLWLSWAMPVTFAIVTSDYVLETQCSEAIAAINKRI